ncbi:MAG: hypothetical protein ACP5VE_01965 [Chthonomonadales bacterium]
MVALVEALPTLLASLAALAVGLASLTVGVSLSVFLTRSVSAFVVFWAIGAVMRALMADAARTAENATTSKHETLAIEPGTPVAQLLEDEQGQQQAHSA